MPLRRLTEIENAAKICFHFGQVMGEVTMPRNLLASA